MDQRLPQLPENDKPVTTDDEEYPSHAGQQLADAIWIAVFGEAPEPMEVRS